VGCPTLTDEVDWPLTALAFACLVAVVLGVVAIRAGTRNARGWIEVAEGKPEVDARYGGEPKYDELSAEGDVQIATGLRRARLYQVVGVLLIPAGAGLPVGLWYRRRPRRSPSPGVVPDRRAPKHRGRKG
jgi:hypothetical protein